MPVEPTVPAALVTVAVSFATFWANPRRGMNRAFFTGSLHVTIWLGSLHFALTSSHGLFWLRLACSVGGLLPMHVWIIQQILAAHLETTLRRWVIRNWIWLLLSLVMALLPFTKYFIPAHSTAEHRVHGWGYYGYILLDLALYAYLLIDSYRTTQRLTGGRRLESQVWLLGACMMTSLILLLMALNAITHRDIYIQLQPLVILVFYSGTAIAISTSRIFDARQLLLVGVQKLALVALVAGAAFVLDYCFRQILPDVFAFVATTICALWFASELNGWLNNVFQFYPQATTARQAAFAVSRRESRLENLESAFIGILKGWGQTDHALLISGGNESLRGGGVELSGDAVAVSALRQLRWVTPERLDREKATPERLALSGFLREHSLGALVIGEGPTLTAFIGVGIPASRRPFTFPQVTQLMELASIIESALERAHFSVKAQHAEQLATVGLLGASLAHEIRNPLVSIKTFVQLLPTHHQDPAFRAKFFSLIGEEVSRIDRLTEQLLDLASPRAYVAEIIELHPVLRASLDLVAAKATDKRIQFLTDFKASPDQALTDASAAKQVLLNLCFNAIQAVETRPGERWVKVSTRNVHLGVEMVVEDSGPGIAPEIRSKLFQPFHSTKSTGFGLGLAICSDILGGLNATISVDSSAPGQGAVFRVTFPCPVLLSS
jgi:signal transduction histidine kinase